MNRTWLAVVDHAPTGAFASAPVTDTTGAPAGHLAAWRTKDAPVPWAAKVDPRAIDPEGGPADVSLVFAPVGVSMPFDDLAVSHALRRAQSLPAPAVLSTLVLGDSRFAGAFTAVRGDDRYERLANDPFATVFPARLLRAGAGLVGTMTEPVGPGIQRYGSTNPWPWDRFR